MKGRALIGQNEMLLRLGGHQFIIQTKLSMSNYFNDIIAEKTPEISDTEEDQPKEEEGKASLALSQKKDYLVTLEDMDLSVNQPASERRSLLKSAQKRSVPDNFIDAQAMISDHRQSRAEVLSSLAKKHHQLKLQEWKTAPKPKLVSMAEVFQQHRPASHQDEELAKIKAKAAAQNVEKAKREEVMLIAQLKHNEARALVEKLERDSYVHPELRIDEHFESQKRCKHSPAKSVSMSTAVMTMVEETTVGEPVESQANDATHLVHQLVLDDKIREANMKRADGATSDLADLRVDSQPMDVFQRMWTPVSLDNPIWRYYCNLLRDLKEKRAKGHRGLAACSRCMTVFFPFFPNDHHLHKRSETFGTAVDDRRVNTCLNAMVETPKERVIYESSTYQALVGLAKEAKAYKKDSTGEYIKLIRLANGTRSRHGKGNYEQLEMCENCDVEFDLKEEARKRFKVQNLAAGILELIFM